MKLKWIVPPTLVAAMAFTGPGLAMAYAASPAAALAAVQNHDRDDWDQAPAEFRDAQRRGFRDGVEAARHDLDHRRRADADDHDSYRHPPVSHDQREDYREGFRRGYERAMEHINGQHDHY